MKYVLIYAMVFVICLCISFARRSQKNNNSDDCDNDESDKLNKIEKLAKLRNEGIIDNEEFEIEKKKILDN